MVVNPWFWLTVAVAAIVYWLTPRGKSWLLTAISIGFLATVDWKSVAAMLVWSGVFYAVGERMTQRPRLKRLLPVLIFALVAYLSYFKYLPLWRDHADAASILVPVGLSYWTFKLIHYLIEASRGRLIGQPPDVFFLYMTLFPIYFAGPIERFDHFLAGRTEKFEPALVLEGGTRIIYGLIKKFIIAELLVAPTANYLTTTFPIPDLHTMPTHLAWKISIASYFYGYLDFSGYSDIAIGCSRLFGLRIIENFNWPFFSVNINDFWKRTHISLSAWCQTYIYLPVIGRTRNPYLATYATMAVIGLWHAGTSGFLGWGLFHGTMIVLYGVWTRTKRRYKWKLAGQGATFAGGVLTFAVVCMSEVFVLTNTIADAFSLIRRLLFIPG